MPLKSDVWKHFRRINKNSASCKICLKTFRSSGNTTNLAKHLKTHPTLKLPSKSVTPNIDTQPSRTSDYPDRPSSSGLSRNTSDTVEDTEVSQLVKESSDIDVRRVPSTIIDFMKRKTSFSDGGAQHSKITNCLLYFICADNRPFNVVEGKGFKRFVKELSPLYKIPKAETLKNKLDDKFQVLKDVYISRFETIFHFCLTCDVWTESMTCKSFLGITLHYCISSSVQSTCIAVEELSERHTGEYLGQCIIDILSSWRIEKEKVVAAVTDNGANIVNAIRNVFGRNKHIPCFAHLLNLVGENAFKKRKLGIIEKIRAVVKWVKGSVVVSDEFRRKQREQGCREGNIKKLILDVKTRWNSVYFMIERFLEFASLLNDMLMNKPEAPPMVTALELATLKTFLEILKPLEFMTREASAQSYVTISKIIPMINCGITKIQNVVCNDADAQEFKLSVLAELKQRFGKIEWNAIIATGTLLDPRFKHIHFQDTQAVAKALALLRATISSEQSSSESEVETTRNDDEDFDFWSLHRQLVIGQSQKRKLINSESLSHAKDELAMYLQNPLSPLSANPLESWEDMKRVFPNLYSIAKKVLPIVATSVPVERIFSKAGATVCQTRNRLLSKRIHKILFLGSCSEDDWFN